MWKNNAVCIKKGVKKLHNYGINLSQGASMIILLYDYMNEQMDMIHITFMCMQLLIADGGFSGQFPHHGHTLIIW